MKTIVNLLTKRKMDIILRIMLFFGSLIYPLICEDSWSMDRFHIRSFSGTCLRYSPSRSKMVSTAVACDVFQWKGLRLFNLAATKCMALENDVDIVLSSQCSETGTLFQYLESERAILHLGTNKCIQMPQSPGNVVRISSDCQNLKSQFWFASHLPIVIRHSNGLCWQYDTSTNQLTLQDSLVCDRFQIWNHKTIKHFASDQFVKIDDAKLLTHMDASIHGKIKSVDALCVKTFDDSVNPASGTKLKLAECVEDQSVMFSAYHIRDTFSVKILSTSFQYIDVHLTKGDITVNGYQYSPNSRGLNVAVFDYRSGLLEHRQGYDTFASQAEVEKCASFLNSVNGEKILIVASRDAPGRLSSSLSSVLEKIGVSARYKEMVLQEELTRTAMACVVFTGQDRKSWEQCNIDKKKVEIQLQINTALDSRGSNDCTREIGLRRGRINNSQLTAGSVLNQNVASYGPHLARLYNTVGTWCSVSSGSVSDYLQVDLGIARFVSGIAMQAAIAAPTHPVKRFSFHYSINGAHWVTYKNSGGSTAEFDGCKNTVGDTAVNWFPRVLLRFIRIVPLQRKDSYHCIRLELFGCQPKGALIDYATFPKSMNVYDQVSQNITILATATKGEEFAFEFSTAKDVASLTTRIDQYHLHKVRNSLGFNNGSTASSMAKIIKHTADTNLHTGTRAIQLLPESDYYNLSIGIDARVIDAGLDTGPIWNTYSYEGSDQIIVYSIPQVIKRSKEDRSILNVTISKTDKTFFKKDDILQLNCSISNLQHGKSKANAYDIEIFIYYATMWFDLVSSQNIKQSLLSLQPTKNETRPGILHFKTAKFSFINRQLLQFDFRFKIPTKIGSSEKCHGNFVVEWKYLNNLKTLNGTVNETLTKTIAYRCKVPHEMTKEANSRLVISRISVLYDDVNDVIFICKNRHDNRNRANCYYCYGNEDTFRQIASLASVVGIDTSSKVLYGIRRRGRGYFRSVTGYHDFGQVNDDEWVSIKDQSNIRKALTASDRAEFPTSPQNLTIFFFQGQKKWAITDKGLFKMKEDKWVKAFQL